MNFRLSIGATAILSSIFVLSATPAPSTGSKDGFQLIYPGNNAYHEPFVEFRERNPGGDSLTGHAFVALGYHLNDGLTAYYAIAGYYRKEVPGQNPLIGHVQAVLGSPGEVSYRFDDWRTDTVLRYPINEGQARRIETILNNAELNPGTFTALQNNCVKFMNDIANVLGLKTQNSIIPPIPISPTPAQAIDYIKNNNTGVQTIQQDAKQQEILKRFRDRVESGAAAVAITPLPVDYNQMRDVHADDPLVGPNAGQRQGFGAGAGPASPGPATQGGGSGNGWMQLYLLGSPPATSK